MVRKASWEAAEQKTKTVLKSDTAEVHLSDTACHTPVICFIWVQTLQSHSRCRRRAKWRERKGDRFRPHSSKHVCQRPSCLIALEPQPAEEKSHLSLSSSGSSLTRVLQFGFNLWPTQNWLFTRWRRRWGSFLLLLLWMIRERRRTTLPQNNSSHTPMPSLN